MSRRSRRGMTLVEVLVVVAIGLSLMLLGSSALLAGYAESDVDPTQLRADRPAPAAVDAWPLEAVDLDAVLDASAVAHGPSVHTLLQVAFDARYVVTADDTGHLFVPLPQGAHDVRVEVRGEDGAARPEPVRFVDGGVSWAGAALPRERLVASVAWRAPALDTFRAPIPATEGPATLHATVHPPAGFAFEVPPAASPPVAHDGVLEWDLPGLVGPAEVQVTVPAAKTLLGRVAAVCWSAVLALGAFCAGFWYLSEADRPGRLDDLRLGGLLLLALDWATFFVVFAVAGGRLGLAAAPLAAAVSLPLLGWHVARLTDPAFAVRRALPLAAVTFAAPVALAWSVDQRGLLLAVLGVAATVFVTVTFAPWSERRRRWVEARDRRERRQLRDLELEPVRRVLAAAADRWSAEWTSAERNAADLAVGGAARAELDRVGRRLGRALGRSRNLLVPPIDDELVPDEVHEQRARQRREEVTRATAHLDALGAALTLSLASLERAAAHAERELRDAHTALEGVMDALSRAPREDDVARALRDEATALAARLADPPDWRGATSEARALARRAGAARPAGSPHCPECGALHHGEGRFCAGCGGARPVACACPACAAVVRLPAALLRPGWERAPLHCCDCGALVPTAA